MTILPSLLYTMLPNDSLNSVNWTSGRTRPISAMILSLHTPEHAPLRMMKKGLRGGSTESASLLVNDEGPSYQRNAPRSTNRILK